MGNSKEYATALFELAAEGDVQQEMYDGLHLAQQVFAAAPELCPYLSSPGILKSTRLQTIRDTFEGEVHEYVVSFLSVLCEHRNMDALQECIREYDKLYQLHNNIARATVTSAEALTEDEKAKLTAKLEQVSGKRVHAVYRIDESLLGGVKVEMEGTIMDGSLKRRLESMKEVMIG